MCMTPCSPMRKFRFTLRLAKVLVRACAVLLLPYASFRVPVVGGGRSGGRNGSWMERVSIVHVTTLLRPVVSCGTRTSFIHRERRETAAACVAPRNLEKTFSSSYFYFPYYNYHYHHYRLNNAPCSIAVSHPRDRDTERSYCLWQLSLSLDDFRRSFTHLSISPFLLHHRILLAAFAETQKLVIILALTKR